MKLYRLDFLLLLSLSWASFGLVGCSSQPATVTATPDSHIAVQTIQVQPEQVRRRVEVVGTLAGAQEVTLSSEVSARVLRIQADLGDQVVQGQTLIELDPTEFQLAVERQSAALVEVLAQLGVKEGKDPLPDPSETSIVRRAAAEAQEARANYDRAKALKEEGVISQQAFDTTEARYRTTQAGYEAALEQVRNLEARVENLRAQLRIAQENLADTRLRAPFAGTVRERLVEVGQYVREQTPVIALASMNPLKLRASVPERWFPHVAAGAAVEVSVEAYPGEKFEGRVTRVGSAVQPDTRAFTIESILENPGGHLRPGLFARAVLETSRAESVIRVPAGAVVSFYGVQKVYSIENGVIREKVVKLGDRFGETIEITEGLAVGDWIATTELARLQEGGSVTVQNSTGGGH